MGPSIQNAANRISWVHVLLDLTTAASLEPQMQFNSGNTELHTSRKTGEKGFNDIFCYVERFVKPTVKLFNINTLVLCIIHSNCWCSWYAFYCFFIKDICRTWHKFIFLIILHYRIFHKYLYWVEHVTGKNREILLLYPFSSFQHKLCTKLSRLFAALRLILQIW